ncbi:FG-GAP-like repeat-containing protein [Crocinitomix algicola]|uniref:FG-GAP-like repeat-containing protein n=1 Tax=Crocinitomix algicola TaxID=1740263 RepID=UPI00087302E6|nr:FG-GAP-like repeat-containing protein [Crocinitomix algicola]
MKIKLFSVSIVLLPLTLSAQSFIEKTVENYRSVIYGEVIWLDKDNDGRSEMFSTGAADDYDHSAQFFNNVGTNDLEEDYFLESIGFSLSSATTADMNNDGYDDFLVSGYNGESNQTRLFLNNGAGSFTNELLEITGVTNGKIRTADFNGDDLIDVIITGVSPESTYISELYFQNEAGEFELQDQVLMPNYFGDVTIFDADEDGSPDILLTGFDLSYTPNTKLFINDGEGNFEEKVESGLPRVYFSGTSAGDYDNDGDLDVLISGMTNSYTPASNIYINDGEGNFVVDETTSFIEMYFGTADFVDVNNDDKLDVFFSGSTSDGVPHTVLYSLTEEGYVLDESFSELTVDVNISSVAWKDYDNDGDLDVFITGFTSEGDRASGFYVNQMNSPTYANFDQEEKPQLTVFPNPNNGTFSLNFENAEARIISIRNLQGQIVYELNVHASIVQLNLTNLPSGVYMLTDKSKNSQQSTLITIE